MALVDFAILTGLPEEFAILKRMLPLVELPPEEGQIWYRGRQKTENGQNYEIVAAFQQDKGPRHAITLTEKILKRWKPAYVVLVGIAGSFDEDVDLGDVLVSQQVFYYDMARADETGIQYRPEGYPCSPFLIRQMQALQLDRGVIRQWQEAAGLSAAGQAERVTGKDEERVQANRQALLQHQPEIHFGTVASGSLIIADEKKKRELLRLHGKIIGTEMEGAGVLHSTSQEESPTPAIVIKGVSDASDKTKELVDSEKCWRELAKENSVRLLLALICRGGIPPLLTDQFDLDLTFGSPAEAREMIPDVLSAGRTSCPAFPRLVVPRGPLTELRIAVSALGEKDPLDIAKTVVVFTDSDGNSQTKRFESPPSVIVLDRPMSRLPVGLYMLLRGVARKIAFRVETPAGSWETEWSPSKQE